MDLFNSLPLKKQEYMNRLFRNCTEEVKYYMSVIDVEADQTFIKAGEECKYIYIILSGKVTGVEWPMHEKSYFFKDFGPGDFFGEIECFAGLPRYRRFWYLTRHERAFPKKWRISVKTLDRNIPKAGRDESI